MNLSRRDDHHSVNHPLTRLHDEITRTFERFFENPLLTQPMPYMPAINMKEEAERFVIEAELPGIDPNMVEIEAHGQTLIIKGEHKRTEQKKEERMHRVERRYGSFHRSITLPEYANLDHVTAEYEHGLLTITVPKHTEPTPRRIEIKKREA
ncbi:Hsp20/alpha crystallin family protein [Laceyella putida]|uniref:Hsp20/alpha crystallin family protein n=1 Tax=Laceyella putida TaxID=110101 RepID=A0ABW2RNK4_9BACL